MQISFDIKLPACQIRAINHDLQPLATIRLFPQLLYRAGMEDISYYTSRWRDMNNVVSLVTWMCSLLLERAF